MYTQSDLFRMFRENGSDVRAIVFFDTVRAIRSYVKSSDGKVVIINWTCAASTNGCVLWPKGYMELDNVSEIATIANKIDFVAFNNLVNTTLAVDVYTSSPLDDNKGFIETENDSTLYRCNDIKFCKMF